MNLSRIYLALAIGLAIPLSSMADIGPEEQVQALKAQMPYREVKPINNQERTKVTAVISFSCHVCAQYHSTISRWGKSLPSSMEFSIAPVANDYETSLLAAVYYNTVKNHPEKADALADSFFSNIQKGLKASDEQFWKAVERDVGKIELNATRENKVAIGKQINEDIKRLNGYKIAETPSLIIGGRYVITPDNVQGNPNLFIDLANGLTSKVIVKNQ